MQEIALKVGMQAKQVTVDNVSDLAEEYFGEWKDGVLTISRPSGDVFYATIDDWIIVFDTGDVHISPNYEFKRLYHVVDTPPEDVVE